MKAVWIALSNLKRLLREKGNIFFVFILPIALILLIGIQFGGGLAPQLGVHLAGEDPLAEAVVATLEETGAVTTVRFESSERLVSAVERGQMSAGVFLPADLYEAIAAGEVVDVGFVARPDGIGNDLRSVVASAVARALKPAGAARFAASETRSGFAGALAIATAAESSLPAVGVTVSYLGESLFPADMGRFDLGAPQQLVLFTFITALTGSAALILTRKLGISSRMLATPTRLWTILAGEGLGRFGVGVFQGIYIMVVSMVMFSVSWGDPLGAVAVLIAFAAVGAGAAMLMGAVFRNEQQAGGVAIVLSLGLAALGGAMLPLELFPPTMQRIALATPHAWALRAFGDLVRNDGTLIDVLPEVGVLALYAAVLIALATWLLRRTLTRGSG
jgi:ABC-2 type transport system permease protein